MGNPLKLSLILHSGAYDQVHHGLSIALSVLSLGGEAGILFTYWALPYVEKEPDGVTATARACAELLGKEAFTDRESKDAAFAARQ